MSDPQFVSSPESVATAAVPPLTYGPGVIPPRQDEYDAVPRLSQGQRVIDTFFAPSRTFADIRRNRSWWLPYILLAILSLAFGIIAVKRVGVDTLLENAQRSNPAQAEKMQNMPPDQRATATRVGGVVMRSVLYSGPILLLFFAAFTALLVWVGCNFILGGSGTYPGMFAVALYSMLPGLIVYLLILIVLFVGDPETFNVNNPVGTNIGYYLPAGTGPFMKSLLSSIDVFSIWQAFLLGLGGAIVARVKRSSGLAMVFGVWLLFILVKAGIAAI